MSNTGILLTAVQRLERQLRGKMQGIRKGTITFENSGVVHLLGLIKAKDEALYEELIVEYKEDILIYRKEFGIDLDN